MTEDELAAKLVEARPVESVPRSAFDDDEGIFGSRDLCINPN